MGDTEQLSQRDTGQLMETDGDNGRHGATFTKGHRATYVGTEQLLETQDNEQPPETDGDTEQL